MANTVGTLNLLQSIVDHDLELEKFDTAGTSEEYGNVRESVSHHHDFDDGGGLILHERSPINPKSIYATSKVAADFLTMNYHDAYGVPARRDAHVQQLRPAPEPALRHGHDHHAGARAARDRARAARPAARLLLLHRRRARPPDGRRAGHPGRRLRLRAGREHLDGRLGGADPARRRGGRLLARRPRGRHDRRALPAGRERGDGAARRLREARGRDRLGRRRSRGRRASGGRSPGTPRTARAGSGASTG